MGWQQLPPQHQLGFRFVSSLQRKPNNAPNMGSIGPGKLGRPATPRPPALPPPPLPSSVTPPPPPGPATTTFLEDGLAPPTAIPPPAAPAASVCCFKQGVDLAAAATTSGGSARAKASQRSSETTGMGTGAVMHSLEITKLGSFVSASTSSRLLTKNSTNLCSCAARPPPGAIPGPGSACASFICVPTLSIRLSRLCTLGGGSHDWRAEAPWALDGCCDVPGAPAGVCSDVCAFCPVLVPSVAACASAAPFCSCGPAPKRCPNAFRYFSMLIPGRWRQLWPPEFPLTLRISCSAYCLRSVHRTLAPSTARSITTGSSKFFCCQRPTSLSVAAGIISVI
mmetsp:Transcript_16455/g.40713  ORF Transcript_16455/g.40713 Transcript_16455/m.40713 type:complete len:338 (-) Transcript_16455:2595-3608(-)